MHRLEAELSTLAQPQEEVNLGPRTSGLTVIHRHGPQACYGALGWAGIQGDSW